MKRKFMLLLTCLFIGIGLVTAQVTKVTGTVISEEDGLPVVGASILVKGTAVGTVTDMDGKFQLPNVPSSAKTLVISFIGMENKEVPIKPSVKVTLKPMTELLSEVLVTGTYGSAKKLGSMVGSVAAVKSEKIANRPSANFADALQGQVAGLQVFTSSGEPSEGVSMRLRGIGSINSSSEPLFILDGAPISSGAFSAINPNDIENLTILKDASSTSIYGSRASNGVVLVTTKKGKAGKVEISYDFMYGVQQPTSLPKIADSWVYAELYNEAAVNSGRAAKFTPEQIAQYRNGGPNVNWVKELYHRNSPQSSHNVSMTGGNDQLSYMASLGYMDQNSMFKGPDYGYKRYNAPVSYTHLTLPTIA